MSKSFAKFQTCLRRVTSQEFLCKQRNYYFMNCIPRTAAASSYSRAVKKSSVRNVKDRNSFRLVASSTLSWWVVIKCLTIFLMKWIYLLTFLHLVIFINLDEIERIAPLRLIWVEHLWNALTSSILFIFFLTWKLSSVAHWTST